MRTPQTSSLAVRLWRDESGALAGADYILGVTILVIGGVVGLVTVRDAMVQNMGDIAVVLGSLDQSYTINYTLSSGTVVDFGYEDPPLPPELQDTELEAPYGIELCEDDMNSNGGTEN